MSGNFLNCSKGVKTHSKFKRKDGISLKMPQLNRASSRLEGRTSWIFLFGVRILSSYYGDVRDTLVYPQERPVSMRVARGLSGFLSSQCRVQRHPLEARPEPKVSSPVLT